MPRWYASTLLLLVGGWLLWSPHMACAAGPPGPHDIMDEWRPLTEAERRALERQEIDRLRLAAIQGLTLLIAEQTCLMKEACQAALSPHNGTYPFHGGSTTSPPVMTVTIGPTGEPTYTLSKKEAGLPDLERMRRILEVIQKFQRYRASASASSPVLP